MSVLEQEESKELFHRGVDRSARAIRARSSRIINVVIAEMEEYTSGEYPANMMESIRILRDHSE